VAVQTYDRVPGVDATSPYAHRARYWSARTVERMGDALDASQRYVALATGIPGEFTAEAGFRHTSCMGRRRARGARARTPLAPANGCCTERPSIEATAEAAGAW
jgi:hypothetical protein